MQQEDSLLAGLQLIKRWEDSEQHSAHQGTGSQEPWSGWLAKQAISNLQWSIDNESEGDGEGDEVQDGMDSAPRANTTGRPADTSMSDTLDVSLDQFINRFEGLGLGSDEDTMDYLGQSYEADQREGEDGAEAEQQTNEAEEEEEGHRGISSESRQFRRVTREHLPAEKIHTKWNETTQAVRLCLQVKFVSA